MLTSRRSITKMNRLVVSVQSSKISRGDYASVARERLAADEFTEHEALEFLSELSGDTLLLDVVLSSGLTTPEVSIELLRKENFDEMLSMSAGKSHCKNEDFLINLLTEAFTINACRARVLTREFKKHLSSDSALQICMSTKNDPQMVRILNPCINNTSH